MISSEAFAFLRTRSGLNQFSASGIEPLSRGEFATNNPAARLSSLGERIKDGRSLPASPENVNNQDDTTKMQRGLPDIRSRWG